MLHSYVKADLSPFFNGYGNANMQNIDIIDIRCETQKVPYFV